MKYLSPFLVILKCFRETVLSVTLISLSSPLPKYETPSLISKTCPVSGPLRIYNLLKLDTSIRSISQHRSDRVAGCFAFYTHTAGSAPLFPRDVPHELAAEFAEPQFASKIRICCTHFALVPLGGLKEAEPEKQPRLDMPAS